MTLKRMVPFVVLGLIWLAAPAGAEAQLCSELCVENVDEDGKFKGFGCTNDGGYLDNCEATTETCSLDACGLGSIVSDDGAVLVVAPLCRWREFLDETAEHVADGPTDEEYAVISER